MARLTRKTNKLFCENAQQADVGQFGSLNAGTKIQTTDVDTIQALSAWGDGWKAATLGDNCYPTRQERNGLDYVQSYLLNYLYQEGIAEWDAGTTYYTGSIVKLINGTDVKFYKSLIDNNTNSLSDTASWEETLISGANKDLSNLSATGVNNLIQYAQELDWDNAINISTTNSSTDQTYTCVDDGLIILQATAGNGATTGSDMAATAQFYISKFSAYNGNSVHDHYARRLVVFTSLYFMKGETATFFIYATGPQPRVTANFIPFKKSL